MKIQGFCFVISFAVYTNSVTIVYSMLGVSCSDSMVKSFTRSFKFKDKKSCKVSVFCFQ